MSLDKNIKSFLDYRQQRNFSYKDVSAVALSEFIEEIDNSKFYVLEGSSEDKSHLALVPAVSGLHTMDGYTIDTKQEAESQVKSMQKLADEHDLGLKYIAMSGKDISEKTKGQGNKFVSSIQF